MKIKYLGTAAAEGMPAIFCECEYCKKAREKGGKNIRTRSQSLIDGRLLIDFPADTYFHCITNNIDLTYIENLLITHTHGDHFLPKELLNRKKGMAVLGENVKPLNIYCTKPAFDALEPLFSSNHMIEDGRATLNLIEPYESFFVDGYKVTTLKANHDQNSGAINYIIQKDGKTMLYGHDSGPFLDETWEFLKENNFKFDLVSLDCTMALGDDGWGMHMSLNENCQIRDKMRELNIVTDKTVFVANHYSHKDSHGIYDDIKPVAESKNIIPTYDGIEIEF